MKHLRLSTPKSHSLNTDQVCISGLTAISLKGQREMRDPLVYRSINKSLGVILRLYPQPSLLSLAVINSITKNNLGKEEFIWLTYCWSLSEVRTGTQGKNLEAKSDTEAKEELHLLPFYSHFIHFALL